MCCVVNQCKALQSVGKALNTVTDMTTQPVHCSTYSILFRETGPWSALGQTARQTALVRALGGANGCTSLQGNVAKLQMGFIRHSMLPRLTHDIMMRPLLAVCRDGCVSFRMPGRPLSRLPHCGVSIGADHCSGIILLAHDELSQVACRVASQSSTQRASPGCQTTAKRRPLQLRAHTQYISHSTSRCQPTLLVERLLRNHCTIISDVQ